MWDLLLSRQELATVLLNYHIGRIVLGSAWNTDTTPTQPHRNSNTHRTKNNTTNVAIQQNSRKLLMMDILMSETRWAHKKWNKITSDIKLIFYSSTSFVMSVCPFFRRHTSSHTGRISITFNIWVIFV